MSLVLQDIILNACRREKIEVEIRDTDGLVTFGIIRGFDNFTVIVDAEKGQVMFYKDNVISITPERPVLVDGYEKKENNA